MNFAMATLGLKEMGKLGNWENAKKYENWVGPHASFPHRRSVKEILLDFWFQKTYEELFTYLSFFASRFLDSIKVSQFTNHLFFFV